VHPGCEMSMHYFSCSGGSGAISIKSAPGDVTPNLCFPSSGICMSLGAFRCVRGVKRQRTIFQDRVGPVLIPQKLCRDTLCGTCVLASSGIYGSRSAFRSIRAMKHRRNIFHARVGPVRFLQKARWDTLCQTCVFVFGGICWSRSAFRCIRAAKC
jgi:hypothetical protein